LLKIRSFRKGTDEDVFVRIFNAVFSDYADIRMMTVEEMKKMEESPTFNADGMFIAEWDGETAGMIDAYIDKSREEKKGFIEWFGVLPEFRGKGIARKLVEKALESHKERGTEFADTWVQSDRHGCLHIFESFGFKPIRTTSLMKRNLSEIPPNAGENRETIIREMRQRDNDELVSLNKLENEAFKEHFNYKPHTVEETKYTLFGMPWFQQQHAYFAILNNEPIGYVVTGIDEGLNKEKSVRYGWILDIGVLKPFRRKRIGTSLMLQGMRILEAQAMDDALLYVDDMNITGALKLYEKLGFKEMRKNFVYRLQLA
jgi:mycothiol synthase